MGKVSVHQLPERITSTDAQCFMSELERYLEAERPRLVFDCSKVSQMDQETVQLLVSCLERAMMTRGDVKLASLREEHVAALRSLGALCLFQNYPSVISAVRQFHRPTAEIGTDLHDADDESLDRVA